MINDNFYTPINFEYICCKQGSGICPGCTEYDHVVCKPVVFLDGDLAICRIVRCTTLYYHKETGEITLPDRTGSMRVIAA